jgi:hypothetical protein
MADHATLEHRPAKFKLLALIAACVVAGGAALAVTPEASSVPRKCVGLFVTSERKTISADSKSLVVVGTIPFAERGVSSWTTQGVYRAFEDGAVELLASPYPPCPEGDAFVWIRYPNPD